MNLGQLSTQAAIFAEDVNQTRFGGLYTNAANRAQEQFVLDSGCLRKEKTYTLVAGQADYDLPTDFLWPIKATHQGLRIDPISRETLEFYQRTKRWDDEAGTPRRYITNPDEARKTFTTVPIPQAEDEGANTVLYYAAKPTEMAADTDTPLNGSTLLAPYHMGIAAYQAWLLLGGEKATPEIMAKFAHLTKIYQGKVLEAIDRFKETPSEPMRMRGGRVW